MKSFFALIALAASTLLAPTVYGGHLQSVGSKAVQKTEAGTASSRTTFQHPVLERWKNLEPITPEKSASLRKLAGELLSLSDAQVVAIIPEQTPLIHHHCPVCDQKEKKVDVLPQANKPFPGSFDPLHPDEVKCKTCGTVFPNQEFPANQTEVFQNMLGENIKVSYWEDTHGPRLYRDLKTGKAHRFYFRGTVDTARKLWLLPRMDALAQLYRSTRDERYARRLSLILDEFSKRYPHYLLTTDYAASYKTAKGGKPPFGFVDTRWGVRADGDLPADLLQMFDLAASSPSMDDAVKKQIVSGLFFDPLKRLELREIDSKDHNTGNECPLKQMVERALVLEDPERVHECYRLIREVPQYAVGCDGFYNQSAGYGSLFRLTFFEGARLLDGYSDPSGFVGKDGLHLENLQLIKQMEEFYYRLCTSPDLLRLPSGGWLSYDDSSPGFGSTWWSGVGESCRPLAGSSNVLLPGLRRAVLGSGTGDRQIQVALDFAEHGVNHGHRSGLTMQIYAFGHSLVDDFPYHKSVLRAYAERTIGHSTVLIDHQGQNGANTDGDVEFYMPLMDGVSAIRVDDTRAYGGVASHYARTLVLNAIDPDLPYVVDVFEVAGGTLHDYHLRSSSQHRSSASASLAVQPVPGLRPLLPEGETWSEPVAQRDSVGSGYGVIFDVAHSHINGPFQFTSACIDPWKAPSEGEKAGAVGAYFASPDSWADRPAIGIRHHVAVGPGYEFISAASPSLTEIGFYGTHGKPVDQWPRIPHRILRHKVQAGHSSTFVVVHEPYHHAPAIHSVTRLQTNDDNVVALRIEAAGRVDTFVYALGRRREIAVGGLRMSGRLGLVSNRTGQPLRACLIEGTALKADGVELKQNAADYSGAVSATERRWDGKGLNRIKVTSNPPLPPGDALRGTWMLVKLGPWTSAKGEDGQEGGGKRFSGATQAVEIDHVGTEDDGTWVFTRGDHGLDLHGNEVQEFYWPHRTFAGACSFIIPTATATHPRPLPPDPQPLCVKAGQPGPGGLKPGFRISVFDGDIRTAGKHKPVSESSMPKSDAKAVEARLRAIPLPGAIRVDGWLTVPADGVYTIHFGCMDEFRMSLGGQSFIETFRGRSLMPETRAVRLSKGCYQVTLECFRQNSSRVPVWLTADWEGPGIARTDFVSSLVIPIPNL